MSSFPSMASPRIIRVLMAGRRMVGKTSLMNQYVNGKFSDRCERTIQVHSLTGEVIIKDELFILQIWDLSGDDKFRVVPCRNIDVCVLVYDVNYAMSFESLNIYQNEFLTELNNQASPYDPEDIPFVLLGNQIDVSGGNRRVVSEEKARAWCASEGNIPYFETSAKEGFNVDVAFEYIAKHALRKEAEKEMLDVLVQRKIIEPEHNMNTFILPSVEKTIETVWEWLNDKDIGTIAIQGRRGTGKTLMAKHAVDRAVASNLFDVILWVEDVDIHNGGDAMKEMQTIADQLILSRDNEEVEVTELELRQKISTSLAEKKYLLILDNMLDGCLQDLGVPNPKRQNKLSKVLINATHHSRYFLVPTDRELYVKSLEEDEVQLLFGKRIGLKVESPSVLELVEPLLKGCTPLPSKILELGEYVIKSLDANLLQTYGELLDLASPQVMNRSMSVLEFLCQMMSSKEVKDCFIYCILYATGHCFSVNGLITSWFLEGFLDGSDSLEEAYEEGHKILKELTDRYLLIQEDDNKVRVNFLLEHQNVHSLKSYIIYMSKSSLFIAGVERPKKCTLISENLETKYSGDIGRSFSKIPCLLLYGNKSCSLCEITDIIFEDWKHLQVLALLQLGISHLPSPLSNLKNLTVLLVRGCGALKNVNQIRALVSLKVLSFSGARSLEEIPDDCFKHMAGLLYLNLSSTQIKKFPSIFSEECRISTLILEGCCHLKTLPYLRAFDELTVLDLSGASALTKIPEILSSLLFLDLSGTFVDKLPSASNLKSITFFYLRGCSQIRAMPHPGEFPDLEVLDLSHTQTFQVPFLPQYAKLQELLLRECHHLEELPHLELQKLEVLDLSGSLQFKKFNNDSFDKLYLLQILNLSGTQIAKLPILSECNHLRQVILRRCSNLETLPNLEKLTQLQVLDLSGAIDFKNFEQDSFRKKENLQELNLSGTQVITIPSLSECHNLRRLVLRDCPMLKELTNLEAPSQLQVLDLSGAISFKKFEQDSFRKKENLQELNLSGTQVGTIPSLSECHNLRKLVLRGCSVLIELPHLESLSRLEVLDLSTSVSFVKFSDQSFGNKHDLQIIDISETKVVELPLLSGCINLCQLVIRDCPSFKTLPPLDNLARLEHLDLSGTKIVDFSFFSLCAELSQLSVRGCSNIETSSFRAMSNLQKVDLSETSITMLPSCFLELQNLCQILLKGCSSLTTLPDLGLVNKLQVLDLSYTKVIELSDGISVTTHLRFLRMRDGNYLWGFDNEELHRFHLCLFSLNEKVKENDIYLQRKAFRDIYRETNHILHSTEEPEKFFKICGFRTFPDGIGEVLNHVEHLYLKKNDFITRLSDLGAENVKAMIDCWVEKCNSMESVFYGEEEEENAALGRHLQNLSVSNLSEATSLFRRVSQSESFACLKHLYVECCPSLVTVFSLHLELINLETLNIRECHKIESIVGEMVLRDRTFPKLIRLTLWKLPNLESICLGELPSLKLVKVKGCPKLERIPVSVNKTGGRVKIKGEVTWWNHLKDEGTKSRMRFTEL